MIISDLHDGMIPGGETEAGLRKRVLMGVLAEHEAQRLGLVVGDEAVAAASRWFRGRFDLLRKDDMIGFLEFAGLDLAEYTRAIRALTTLDAVQRHHAPAIDAGLPRQRALLSVREWLLRKEGV
ncbi:MAG: hypothetical protein R3B09_00775 [Nannocystaceae bacterium]